MNIPFIVSKAGGSSKKSDVEVSLPYDCSYVWLCKCVRSCEEKDLVLLSISHFEKSFFLFLEN